MMNWFDDPDDMHRPQHMRVTVKDVDDSGPQQLVRLTGLANHEIGETVRSQHFGLSSVPPPGSEGLMHALGGRMDRGHSLGLEHPKYRPVKQPSGSTWLYDASGNAISLVQKNIRIVAPTSVEINAPKIYLVGKVYLGDKNANRALALKDSVDSAGDTEVSNLATKVWGV